MTAPTREISPTAPAAGPAVLPTASAGGSTGGEFRTVFGRNLIGELRNFVHRPYLVVTMEDLWPHFEHHFDSHLAGLHFVRTLDLDELTAEAERLPAIGSIVGIGGGQ